MLKHNTLKSGVYILRFPNGDYYGGRATNFQARWGSHFCYLRAGEHHNLHVQRVFTKYGDFIPEVVSFIADRLARKQAEQAWLDEYYGKAGCLNIDPSAEGDFGGTIWITDGTKNQRLLPEAAAPLLESGTWQTGKTLKPGTVYKNKGQPLTPAQIAGNKVAGEKRKGRVRSPEAIAKTAVGNRGRKNTPKGLANLQAAGEKRRGQKRDPEVVAQIAEKHRGNRHTDEAKAKMSEAKRGKPFIRSESGQASYREKRAGRVWAHNGEEELQLPAGEVDSYLGRGWVVGRKKRKPLSEEALANIRAAGEKRRGRKRDPEVIARIWEGNKKTKNSPEATERRIRKAQERVALLIGEEHAVLGALTE